MEAIISGRVRNDRLSRRDTARQEVSQQLLEEREEAELKTLLAAFEDYDVRGCLRAEEIDEFAEGRMDEIDFWEADVHLQSCRACYAKVVAAQKAHESFRARQRENTWKALGDDLDWWF